MVQPSLLHSSLRIAVVGSSLMVIPQSDKNNETKNKDYKHKKRARSLLDYCFGEVRFASDIGKLSCASHSSATFLNISTDGPGILPR